MPELPEVESARVRLNRAARGRKIVAVHVQPDPLVFSKQSPKVFRAALAGRKVTSTGRLGKNFWAELNGPLWIVFHFGMSGSMEIYSNPQQRPSHWKMEWILSGGKRVAWRDPRRFGRIRLVKDIKQDAKLSRLGFDPLLSLPPLGELKKLLKARKKNIKGLLLDQSFSAGVGNWIADEILYQAKIAPKRFSTSLTDAEMARLRLIMKKVISFAVSVGADSDRFPKSWLFHHRWSSRKDPLPSGAQMIRETVSGRTTAWVPEVQI